jgi:hypothetical protein
MQHVLHESKTFVAIQPSRVQRPPADICKKLPTEHDVQSQNIHTYIQSINKGPGIVVFESRQGVRFLGVAIM